MGRVEGEAAGLQLVDGGAIDGAAVALAELLLLERARVRGRDDHDPLPQPDGGLDRVGQPRGVRVGMLGTEGRAVLVRVAHHEAVDHDLHGVALVLVEGRRGVQVELLPVHADAHEALRRAPSKTRSPSVLRSRMTGPRTSRRLPSGIARMRSTICDTVMRAISWPLGQCG